jgi:hypothetical protein
MDYRGRKVMDAMARHGADVSAVWRERHHCEHCNND